MKAHRASQAEQFLYGVEWRRVGSAWYTQRRAPHYPAPEGYSGLKRAYAALRAKKTRELAAPAAYALTGDGKRANLERDPSKIMQARYWDWLDARDETRKQRNER